MFTAGCSQQLIVEDPYHPTNSQIYQQFRDTDKSFWEPASKKYASTFNKETIGLAGNFFNNLLGIRNFINNVLQGKFIQAAEQLSRFFMNTVFGIFGIIDVAKEIGLKDHPEDFGQTLAVWGYKSTNYLMLPLIGPTTQRDILGYLFDFAVSSPLALADISNPIRTSIFVANGIHVRYENTETLDFIDSAGIDSYGFFKNLWIEQRHLDIQDGILNDSDNEFDDIFDEDDEIIDVDE